MTSKGLQVLLIRSYDRFRFFVGSKLDSTAGAHQPTFLSLRDPAKALHQRAPKARVGRGHYIILPQCNRKKYHCEQRFSPAAARMIYYFIFLIIWGGGAQHSQRSSTPPTFIKFLVGIVSKVSIFSIASIVRHPLPFFIKSLVQLAQLIQLGTSAPPPLFIKLLVYLLQLAYLAQLDTTLILSKCWYSQHSQQSQTPTLLSNYWYSLQRYSQHSSHSQTPPSPLIKQQYSQNTQHGSSS